MRQICTTRSCNYQIYIVIVFTLLNYVSVTYLFLILLKPSYYIPSLVLINLGFFMLGWSFIKSYIADPGRVPIYWGFFLDQNEARRKRYCLICHSFKPQRCHHCSTCQRCVLNMDHHCPWLGNCVGYFNKKFFILFLTYIIITITLSLLSITYPLIQQIILMFTDFSSAGVLAIVRILSYIVLFAFFITISIFYKFHLTLVFTNTTTIDNLEKERNPNANKVNVFDAGCYDNFTSVFGTNPLLWPIPIYGQTGKPTGDGVKWHKNDQ